MKSVKNISAITILSILMIVGCENPLQEEVYSELAPETVLTNREGIEAVLISAYGNITWPGRTRMNNLEEYPTDIIWQTGGGENQTARPMIEWTWEPSTSIFDQAYNRQYNTIRDANLMLENIDDVEGMPQDQVDAYIAEARFLRAWAYYRLYLWFGPTPLRTATEDPMAMPRASEEEMVEFIETELLAAIPDLPEPGQERNYSRATNGAAMSLLAKFYLNTHQWEKAADMAGDVINANYYDLYPVFEDLLKVENERNSEIILTNPAHPEGPGGNDGQNYMNGAFPPQFAEWPEKNFEMMSNWANWASQYRLREDFYNSFDPDDERLEPILTEYVNNSGNTVDLLNDFEDNIRSFRYWPDPNASGNLHGNDVPEIRYADIILTRAEALNEMNGPNSESISLINEIRSRAGLDHKPVELADFASKEELRNHILNERKWEFYSEGQRRLDLIRHNQFVENAQSRGISNASEHRIRYPLPQNALDANPELEQNDVY